MDVQRKSQDCSLTHLDELLIPLPDLSLSSLRLLRLVSLRRRRQRVLLMVIAVLENLLEDARGNIRQGDGLCGFSEICL